MTNRNHRILIFLRDYTNRGGDVYMWWAEGSVSHTTPAEVVGFGGLVICHDFWVIRDALFDATKSIPRSIVDLDDFRVTISGKPEDRAAREQRQITESLGDFGLSSEDCAEYKRIFLRQREFDAEVAGRVGQSMESMYFALLDDANDSNELSRYFDVEVPAAYVVQRAMTSGVNIDDSLLSELRLSAEHDYFVALKDYSAKHDMPIEAPSIKEIERRLLDRHFDLTEVSVDYILQFLTHDDDFGEDTIHLRQLRTTYDILSSITLSTSRVRPIADVFGTRTSRVVLRSPPLQNIAKKYRRIIVPNEGCSLSYVDYDQYEVGIMAALSGDAELLTLYKAGDMYDQFARDYLGIGDNRKAAKRLFLSYAYGMSRKALEDAAVNLGASRQRAKEAFRRFTAYEAWKGTVASDFERTGVVGTACGNFYKRQGKGSLSPKEGRSSVSQVVQGTASLIFKQALIELEKLPDIQIVLPMHDAVLFSHRTDETPPKVVKAFEAVMTQQLGGAIDGKASIGRFFPDDLRAPR